jgi:hypothetical protein
MKVSIQSLATFEHVKPTDIAAYAATSGWQLLQDRPGHSSRFTKKLPGGEMAELLVPFDRQLKDFSLRVADAIKLLSVVEDRSELALLDDVMISGMDVFRFQVVTPEVVSGTVPAERGAEIFESIPKLFTAGAQTAETPRARYGPKKSKDVKNFVQHLRFGQTEIGSYVVRVLSPVSPVVFTNLLSDYEEPFERRAASALMRGLQSVSSASFPLAGQKQLDSEELIQNGVSANLCSALTKIAGTEMRPQDSLHVHYRPARIRPLVAETPFQVSFAGELIPRIRETARLLREISPRDEEISGYVIKLETHETGSLPAGPIVISSLIDGRQRKVTISLGAEEHQKAVHAYQHGLEVACRGTLKKIGQSWSLLEPGKLSMAETV